MSKEGVRVSEKELKRRNFILHGNLYAVMAVIALPLFLFSIVNGFNDILDNFMSAGISQVAVSASAQMSQVKNMIMALGQGIASGGSIMIAREIGRKRYDKARAIASTSFTLVFGVDVIILLIFIPFARPVLSAFGVNDPEVLDAGVNYFRLIMIGAAFSMINNVFVGAEKARGATALITGLNLGVMAIKIILNVIFIYVMKIDDMTWVGLASAISYGSLTLYIFIRLFIRGKREYIFSYTLTGADWSKKSLKRLGGLSFPIFLGKFIFSLGKVSVNALVDGISRPYEEDKIFNQYRHKVSIYEYYHTPKENGGLGVYTNGVFDDRATYTKYVSMTKGALGVSNNMGGMVTNALSSIEDTESSVISTNLGAGQTKRAIKAFYVGLIYALGIAVIGVAIISIPAVNDAIVDLFARGEDSEMAREAYATMISGIFFFEKMGIVTLAVNSSVLGLLYGFGYTKVSMVMNIARVFVFRIPALIVCKACNMDYHAVGVSMGISNAAIGLAAVVVAFAVIHNIKKKEKEKEEARMLSEEDKKKCEKFIKNYLSNFSHYKPDIAWTYEDGVVMKGALTMYEATKDPFYLDFLIKHYDSCIDENGKIKGYDPEERNIDNTQKATALFLLNHIHHEEKYDKALAEVEHQLDIQNRTKSGSFWHKDIYPWQIWLDGLYMGMPLYALYATEEKDGKKVRDILNQFDNVEKYNWDPEKKVYMHCYDETKSMQWADKDNGRSPNVWLRSVGWLAMADSDVYETFKKNGNSLAAHRIRPLLKKVLDSMEPYEEKKSHLWYDLPLLPEEKGNYLEISGSVMFAYGYLKGARTGMIDYAEMKKGSAILESIVHDYLTDTELKNICKVSGLDNNRRDGSVAYYLSEPVVSNDAKGVGPFMMAYGEYLKVTK